jgi:hypothetical protein
MNVYIWNRVDQASDSYHSEGGVVVFADSLDEARSLANATDGCEILDKEQPDETRACADGPKKVFIMPDAGCC